jgi:hypothetical protein
MIQQKLPIAPRLQWKDRAGYCGECSIQQAALYYGNYVSQYVCRQIIDPEQEQDVLVRVNADQVLKALRLKFEEFDTSNTPTPQYKPYLAWTKRHLHRGHPVIITLFDQDDSYWDYDHIALAIGFQSTDAETWQAEDTLHFHDNFDDEVQSRKFKTLHDTREMKGNGAEHYFCIPATHAFGCAVTGNADESGALVPVRLTASHVEEPDVVNDEKPIMFTLKVTISQLKPGRTYVLYRYDNHKHLPTKDYHKSKFATARKFKADKATHEFTDECASNGAAYYRCLLAEND